MWKNQGFNKRLEVYTVYKVKGLNLDSLINTARSRGVTLYDVKKISNKYMSVTVKIEQCQKFFAIAEELCYNIEKVRDKGRDYPILLLFKSLGLFIGAVIFVFSAFIFDDVIFAVDYSGSGSVYKREVENYLNEMGVKEFSRFSSVELSLLEDKILASNEHLSFVSCKKNGNHLNVELVLSQEKVKTLDGNVLELRSDVNGIVESVKVYRGTAMVKVGDEVRVGDLIVDGKVVLKEQTVQTNVLASVTILVSGEYEYRSINDGEEERAIVLAEESIKDKEIINSTVEKTQSGKEYIYKVQLRYRRVYCVG